MNKNKVSFIIYILLFCAFITGICFFYLGKSFGIKTMETGSNAIDREEIKNNELLIETEFNKLVEYLNKENKYPDDFIHSSNKYNFLEDIAPLVMEKVYNAEYEDAKYCKVMDSVNYSKLKEYFNVKLKKYDEMSNYYIAYSKIMNFNSYNFELEKIQKIEDKFSAEVMVYNKKQLISKGTITALVKNGHIYYESFYLNEH